MLDFGHPIPFVDHLGFTLHHMEDGESELRFEARPEHLNTFDVTHGGATMTLLDVTMAVAARSLQQDMGCVTIEMKTSFMQPARGPLVAKGVVLHRTRSMAYTEARVFDASGRLCSHATGTFKYMPRVARPAATGAGDSTLATD
ncbi:PaaI family thioesterase [Delftia sp. PS-11]|uniref:PaaI family thioesterase n=1 Tax=Delftia sp. PS-11 TaxID=2767222 RepID=UPI002455B6C3|nr:PaaI family thioesterase [Delftia sp. PS-11]KAJ8744546.1 PaaI family thioesterase [Delftia sp. PS-11]